MDAYDKIQNASFMMLEAFKDFKEVFASLSDRGEGQKPEMGPLKEVKMKSSMEAVEEAIKSLLDDKEEDYDADCEEDFPAQPHFKFEDINADDPRFATGLQVGIPYAVAVRNEDGQGMLIPIKSGMFNGGY